jgi:hypothetical protein
MFFKKGLRDSSLICKLTMKNPRTSEEMFAITNKYALAKEAILDTREQKKKKESSHSNQPRSSKDHDKKRKANRFVANVERSHRNKEYQPMSGEFEGFLDRICIFHPKGKHKTWDCDQLQGFTDEVLKIAKKAGQEKKPKDPKGGLPEAHKEVNYIYCEPDSYDSLHRRSWRSQPPPPST